MLSMLKQGCSNYRQQRFREPLNLERFVCTGSAIDLSSYMGLLHISEEVTIYRGSKVTLVGLF